MLRVDASACLVLSEGDGLMTDSKPQHISKRQAHLSGWAFGDQVDVGWSLVGGGPAPVLHSSSADFADVCMLGAPPVTPTVALTGLCAWRGKGGGPARQIIGLHTLMRDSACCRSYFDLHRLVPSA
eukprot:364651-Chlamydomonas_euryale.AAC.2